MGPPGPPHSVADVYMWLQSVSLARPKLLPLCFIPFSLFATADTINTSFISSNYLRLHFFLLVLS